MHPDSLPRLVHGELPATVRDFLAEASSWPVDRWERVVSHSRIGDVPKRRRTSAALRDAILANERLQVAAWFAEDAAVTAAQLVPDALGDADRAAAALLLTDAALALLARPALPTVDFAFLIAPFLPLHLGIQSDPVAQ